MPASTVHAVSKMQQTMVSNCLLNILPNFLPFRTVAFLITIQIAFLILIFLIFLLLHVSVLLD